MYGIVSVSPNWNIGYKNQLLYDVAEDKKFFRNMTDKGIVIMGRQTYETLPSQYYLKDRILVVLTRTPIEFLTQLPIDVIREHECSNTLTKVYACSLNDLYVMLSSLKAQYNIPENNVWVAGGAIVYKLLLHKCEKVYVTKFSREPFLIQDNQHVASICPLDNDKNWKRSTIPGFNTKFTGLTNRLHPEAGPVECEVFTYTNMRIKNINDQAYIERSFNHNMTDIHNTLIGKFESIYDQFVNFSVQHDYVEQILPLADHRYNRNYDIRVRYSLIKK